MRVYGADKVWRQLHREEQAVARCTVERLMRHIKKAAMKCPVCGAAELIHDTRDVPYTYKGETTVIAG